MADTRQHVLVVGAKQAGLERVAPMLRRADFSVHTVEPSPFLHDLVLSTAFELVVVTYPLEDISLDQLLQTIRNEGSACHNAGLLLLAEPDHIDEAQARVDLGANRAICTDWNEARLWRAIGDLLEVAPRVSMRVLIHADVEVTRNRNRAIFQTVNVSKSGALLQGHDSLDPGTNFNFLFRLPGGGLIDGTAEVVRRTNSSREGVEGVGARFADIRAPSFERLVTHLNRQIELGNRR
jgi:CheY-like chemotaxis protein